MQKRVMTVAIAAVLGLGALAVAQAPPFTVQADRTVVQARWGPVSQSAPVVKQTTLTGNVVFQVNGVLVRADRAVMKDGEVELEGNVRLTLPMPK